MGQVLLKLAARSLTGKVLRLIAVAAVLFNNAGAEALTRCPTPYSNSGSVGVMDPLILLPLFFMMFRMVYNSLDQNCG